MKTERWNSLNDIFHEALELQKHERTEFLNKRCGGQPELKHEVQKLIESAESDTGFLQKNAVRTVEDYYSENKNFQGKSIGQYRIIEEIGRGGMGAVFLAERADKEFDQKVAIKIVHNQFANDTLLTRFRNERQILASLKHPNIAHLIDGGTTEDGLPYFVMEYVEGESLLKYCDRNKLDTDERLIIFQKICLAVSYAHKNLIIHRDIKPTNILVMKDGSPKLLDFGIAKPFLTEKSEEPPALTQTGGRMLTPDYASPEQINGEAVATSTDIYSLGVVLYELLTGYRPYRLSDQSPLEALRIILEQEPVRPSTAFGFTKEMLSGSSERSKTVTEAVCETRNTTPDRLRKILSGDLDNILLKSLRKEPERRYSTVNQFSEDIQRHLESLPIIARSNTFGYKAEKFVRRNWVGSIAMLIVAVAISGALVISIWQTVVAREERAKAEKRFNQVRKLANTVLFEYHDNVAKLTGSTPLREKMVKDSLEYLDNLAGEDGNDVALQREIASAYVKIGDVQGDTTGANLGDLKGAIVSYKRAFSIRDTIYRRDPNDPISIGEIGGSYSKIGYFHFGNGKFDEALSNFSSALSHFDELLKKNRVEIDVYFKAARAEHGLGLTLLKSSKPDVALKHFNNELKLCEQIRKQEPENIDLKETIAKTYVKLGDAHYQKKAYNEALKYFLAGLSEGEALIELEGDNAKFKRIVALSSMRVSLANTKINNWKESLKFAQNALRMQKELADSDPANIRSKIDIGATYGNIAEIQGQLKDHSSATANFQNSIGVFEALREKNPDQREIKQFSGMSNIMFGEYLGKRNRAKEAIKYLEKGLRVFDTKVLKERFKEYLGKRRVLLNNLKAKK